MGTLGEKALSLAARPVAWQWVLHGPSDGLREEVTKAILEHSGEKAAFRYACCGLGDCVRSKGEEKSIQPRGCGHRLCPRCSKQRGQKKARRVFAWLAAAPHGDLHCLCITQGVVEGESLVDARDRMEKKARRFLKILKGKALLSVMLSTHIVWSLAGQGWHYHIHLVLESEANTFSCDWLRYKWQETALPEKVQCAEESVRLVMAAGPAMPDLASDGGDTHFWKESANAAAKAIQYPIRDMVQGVAVFRFGGQRERVAECVRELLRSSSGWKLRRTLGRWRQPAPPVPLPGVPDAGHAPEKGTVAAPAEKIVIEGQVCGLYVKARGGCVNSRALFRSLERNVGNRSDFAKRYVLFCRRAWGAYSDG